MDVEVCLSPSSPKEVLASVATAFPPAPTVTLETLQEQMVSLASSQELDKIAALTMTRLFHSLETLMRHECAARDRKLIEVQNQLERLRLQNELQTQQQQQQQMLVQEDSGKKRRR